MDHAVHIKRKNMKNTSRNASARHHAAENKKDRRTVFTDYDSYLFHEGTHYELYRKLGAHPDTEDGVEGTRFLVWAPHAVYASVITAKTCWENERWMHRSAWDHGVWECFLPGVGAGDAYRYVITGADGVKRYKSDPFAFWSEKRPANASIVWDLSTFSWNDGAYQARRSHASFLEKPMSIYEVHLASWKKEFRDETDHDGFVNYRRLADELAEYVNSIGFTHIELIGICEHPLDESWGYQVTGYYSPTSRFGTPDDFRYFVNTMHQAGIGVILDWVPAHFPKDEFGLGSFDGTPLYEYSDPLLREFSTWKTLAFDHGRREVRSFLISNAIYWIQEYHIDAIRVDAVGAMLHYDLDRAEWRPNVHGGRLNLKSWAFLQQLNSVVRSRTRACLMAEDSTVELGITADVQSGGLGFTFKWNIGWMYDTLYYYMALDPSIRKWHHETLTRIADFAFQENFILELCHDECAHKKGSMVNKAPGSEADRMKQLKSLYVWQYTHPGKKLLFMGQEFAMDKEWNVREELDWELAQNPVNRDITRCLARLISIYKSYPSLYMDSKNPAIFEWVNREDAERSVISFIRRNPRSYAGAVLAVISFSPMEYPDYRVGVPMGGSCTRIFSSYDTSPAEGIETPTPVKTEKHPCDGYSHRISLHLRPFESVILELPRQRRRGSR